MDSLFEILDAYTQKIAVAGRLKLTCLALFIAGIALSVGGIFIHIQIITVTLGCFAGLSWMIIGYMIWDALLTKDWKEKLDLRGRWEVKKRRWVIAWATISWFLILGFIGKSIPQSIIGGISVAVLLSFWRIAGMTELERALDEEEAHINSWPIEDLEDPKA